MIDYAPYVAPSLLLVFAWAFYHYQSSLPSKLPYPPGPPEHGLFSGNLSDLPASHAWHTYVEWGKKYGNLLHYRVLNKHTIILNSYEDNINLLKKRSALFSDRPEVPMVTLMGWVDFDAAFMPYGSHWRTHRRIYQQVFKPEVSLKYRPAQTKKIREFLYALVTSPQDLKSHYRTLASAVIISILYAYDVAPKNDHLVELTEAAMSDVCACGFPGASLLYAFPLLRYTPAWFPGAEFKRFAIRARKMAFEMCDAPISAVKKQIQDGITPNCVSTDLLESCKTKEDFDDISGVVATSNAAGSDTTAATIGTFFNAMCLYPEIQAKAQKAIDNYIGCSDRLVTYDDRSALPYIEALHREVMRWRPVVPLGIAHASTSADIYKGCFIPKGATVISNIWAIAHNPEQYPEPEIFKPERFFNENMELNNDKLEYVFGFGRRICPGRHLASATVWLTIATVLQTFNIRPAKDSNGTKLSLQDLKYSDGMVSHPLGLECSITPRSALERQLILDAVGKA